MFTDQVIIAFLLFDSESMDISVSALECDGFSTFDALQTNLKMKLCGSKLQQCHEL